MEKMLNDPKTPPKLKESLWRDIDAYTVPKPSFHQKEHEADCCKLLKKQRESSICQKVKG